MAKKGEIVAGVLAPHPPHLVYAENPDQNEPTAECGWETLRWGYERLRKSLSEIDYDVLIVHSPHWRTQVGTHFLGVEKFKSLSVDPIFPNLFRFHYDLTVDVNLAQGIHDEAKGAGLVTEMMTNPDFRVDYGTIVSCHMTNPDWDKPLVGISSNGGARYFNMDVLGATMLKLGEATRKAVEASGKRAVLLASNSLSHRHFTTESEVVEDMSKEHINNHNQYLWDMRMIEMMRSGKGQQVLDVMTDFTEQATAETDGGSLTWLLSALGVPDYPATLHGYGTVIGTGNAVMEWRPGQEARA
ncbi:MAG: tRNA U-34 5-methylaminomethyl-2-thiouridine biosynthesis protein [Bdellovibrionales bacterium]|nr:tRNA U-34 5-methylaminomethyl-2-thiouridine biosynthesis protein [Bdellovibrionales bacterium]